MVLVIPWFIILYFTLQDVRIVDHESDQGQAPPTLVSPGTHHRYPLARASSNSRLTLSSPAAWLHPPTFRALLDQAAAL